ncbi:S24 family peptidase [Mesorhizobium sp. CAU 1732]|uniref:XRE family transcriptional regulator n=1 Tax=Mesorhizobium sp. CAU 1732 TaxID=3140358 RepID=UPI003261563C
METFDVNDSGSLLAQRIRQRLDETGRSASEVSLACGYGTDFIRDFLTGRKKKINSEALARIAHELGTTVAWLLGDDDAIQEAGDTQPAQQMVPVYGMAAGSRLGAAHHETEIIEWVPAPPGLARVRDAYMLYVDGVSMYPRFKHRDPIFVAPHQPAWPGDDVVILIRNSRTGEYQTWVKELVTINPDEIVTKQYNPGDEIHFNRSEVIEMHRILPLNEIVGLTE